MHLIIPGSLPPTSVAPDLLPHLQTHCPALVSRLERLSGQPTLHAPEAAGCTALEFLQLVQQGYVAKNNLTFGAGLGAWRAGMTNPSEAVWIAELCSVAIGRDGAQLVSSDWLNIAPSEADALFEAAQPLWAESAISVLPLTTGRWRVWLPADAQLNSITPAAVSSLAVADWWPQHPSMKSWRKLLNEVQMLWHNHPTNNARLERGLHPINSLWIYGGAPGWKSTRPASQAVYYEGLAEAFSKGDWLAWIEQLPALSNYLESAPADASITLVGERRYVDLNALKRRWWQYLLPAGKQNWTSWWISQK